VPIALDRRGRVIQATAKVAFLNEPAAYWQTASSHPGSAKPGAQRRRPPVARSTPAACGALIRSTAPSCSAFVGSLSSSATPTFPVPTRPCSIRAS
jgi:hypothetical protein